VTASRVTLLAATAWDTAMVCGAGFAKVPNWDAEFAVGLNAYAGIAMVATSPAARVITTILMMLRLVFLRGDF
jgi:hypothetical protein